MWSRTRSNTGSRVRLRMLAESVDGIIKTGRKWRSGGFGVHTSGGGGLPDLVSFSSKLARIRDILSHQLGPDVGREIIEKESFNRKHSSLCTLWARGSKEYILPIKVKGFLSAAKVRDIHA